MYVEDAYGSSGEVCLASLSPPLLALGCMAGTASSGIVYYRKIGARP